MGDIFSCPANVPVGIHTGIYRCRDCGTVAFNVKAISIPTDDYKFLADKLRRCFYFQGQNPVCGCTDHMWLSDDQSDETVLSAANSDGRRLEPGHLSGGEPSQLARFEMV